MIITEFPPNVPSAEISGGRVQSISVNPTNPNHIIVANQFCGLWKTVNGGSNWFHLDGLLTVFVRDVAYSPDGETVIATLERDNQVKNGGGIWVSRDGGGKWYKPASGDPHNVRLPDGSKLPNLDRIPSRISAYGISYSPDDAKTVYVGTDYGVAVSSDNGETWHHKMLDKTSSIYLDYGFGELKKQNAIPCILSLPNNKVMALCSTGVYLSKESFKEGKKWTWNRIRDGNFTFQPYCSCKNIDVSPLDNDKIFILQNYSTLLLYELETNMWTVIDLSLDTLGRGPFVRISKNSASSSSIDVWLGLGRLYRATCMNIDAVKALKSKDWIRMESDVGLHADTGYLGINNKKLPTLYGCDGGLFKPINAEATKWTRITVKSGLNSLQIVNVAGTNVRSPKHTCLYFGTQDNSVWASADDGYSWPNSDGGEGFFFQVMKDAKSDSEVTVAYCQIGDDSSKRIISSCRFSDAHLVNQRNVPDMIDLGGGRFGRLSDPHQAFFISPGKWIRLDRWSPKRFHSPDIPEIYVSQDNGEIWRKIATVDLECHGIFAISKWVPIATIDDFEDPKHRYHEPVVYIPFKGNRTRPDGKPIIGLIRLVDIFGPTARHYDEADLIYLKDNGSLGERFTEFDWHAVFAVDPKNPHFIIAPDIYNNRVMVSDDSGLSWRIDKNLTREVTKDKKLLVYDEHPIRMQVTRISFDPYNRNQIFVGTRDAGVILSTDGGGTWNTIPNTNKITYVTDFFFEPRGDTVIVSSYGRGLWKIHTGILETPFPIKSYCRDKYTDCRFRLPFSPKPPIYERIDWTNKDVVVFLNGKVNGLALSNSKIKSISVSPGTSIKRYLGKTKNFRDLNIVESEKGQRFDNELKGCRSAVNSGEIIKAIVLEENKIIGIISGKSAFKEKERATNVGPNLTKGESEKGFDYNSNSKIKSNNSSTSNAPYLFISTSIPIMGTSVVGRDGIINLRAKGFKFRSKGTNKVRIFIDSQEVGKSVMVTQNGNAKCRLRVPRDLAHGIHDVRMVQNLSHEAITARGSFVKAMMDEIKVDKNVKETQL